MLRGGACLHPAKAYNPTDQVSSCSESALNKVARLFSHSLPASPSSQPKKRAAPSPQLSAVAAAVGLHAVAEVGRTCHPCPWLLSWTAAHCQARLSATKRDDEQSGGRVHVSMVLAPRRGAASNPPKLQEWCRCSAVPTILASLCCPALAPQGWQSASWPWSGTGPRYARASAKRGPLPARSFRRAGCRCTGPEPPKSQCKQQQQCQALSRSLSLPVSPSRLPPSYRKVVGMLWPACASSTRSTRIAGARPCPALYC